MATTVDHTPQITGLQISVLNTLTQIDAALDRGDRRAFRLWTTRYLSLTRRLATLLVAAVTAET